MKNVEIAFDIDPKSFIKSSRKCAILDIDYYNELKAKADKQEAKNLLKKPPYQYMVDLIGTNVQLATI